MASKTIGLAVAALLLFGGCDPESEEAAPAPTPTIAATPEPDPTCPLTGEEPPRKVDLDRPAVAVKIENSPQSRPQHGLEHADLVFEEIVEGGITRFMAIYHCGSSEDAGPIRSARFDDPMIARPFTRVIAYSGANGLVDAELRNRKMVLLNEINQRGAFFRVPPGAILVHNLFVRTEVLRNDKAVRKVEPPESDIFTFGEVQDGAKKVRNIRMNFSANITIEYKWRDGAWKRYEAGPFMTNTGQQIAVPNVLIQQVDVNNSRRLLDSAGNPSPRVLLKGKGRALLFRDGRVIKGTWLMKNGRPYYRTPSGDDFVFAKGPIWVELVPSKKGHVKGSFSFN